MILLNKIRYNHKSKTLTPIAHISIFPTAGASGSTLLNRIGRAQPSVLVSQEPVLRLLLHADGTVREQKINRGEQKNNFKKF